MASHIISAKSQQGTSNVTIMRMYLARPPECHRSQSSECHIIGLSSIRRLDLKRVLH